MIGQSLSHYRIEEKLGEGGMGVVYRARDTHLERPVAIKILRSEAVGDPDRKRRFIQEAKAASALSHPNIVTIHDIASDHGVDFIVMEYAEGATLNRIIADGGLPQDRAVDYALQVATALSAAHEAGIIHRDVKPANLLVTRQGYVKVLDFGLAKLTERRDTLQADMEGATIGSETALSGAASGASAAAMAPPDASGPHTQAGVILGTLSYLSPEQAEGQQVDARADIFSLGAVLFEMLSGLRAFQGDSRLSTLTAILRDAPAVSALPPGVPPALTKIVLRCLEKQPNLRYASAAELRQELAACQAKLAAPTGRVRTLLRRPVLVVPALLLLLSAIAGGIWFGVRDSRIRWARQRALPEVERLLSQEKYIEAFRLARQAERYIPNDRQLQQLWLGFTYTPAVRTNPPGADVYFKAYMAPSDAWEYAGQSPLQNQRIPRGHLRWKISKTGYETVEAALPFAFLAEGARELPLSAAGSVPEGMVRVLGGRYRYRNAPAVELQDFWLDQHEVTNRQFRQFLDAGGYQKQGYWKHPFVKEGRALSWEQAMAEFRDSTGRPGPATWELGTYPEGRGDLPVNGVSWFEAAAYSEFAGKALPTFHHWFKATELPTPSSEILLLSNFGGKKLAVVGTHAGLGPHGTYDMAGNAKEWVWTQTGEKRYILGGAWHEPDYMYTHTEALPPFNRSADIGFRCAKYESPPSETALAPVETVARDFAKQKPAGDDIFRAYRNFYSYDRGDLQANVEAADDSPDHWRKETASFNAAYGNERVLAHLFLPKNAAPPYQWVVFFPGAGALLARSSKDVERAWVAESIIRSGRALMFPIYKGSYERRTEGTLGPSQVRDRTVQWVKDLGRSIDYLETRRDFDKQKLGYLGFSMGSAYGVINLALEPRIHSAAWLIGGLYLSERLPEIDQIHFAPRVRVPVLMINGRQDFFFPLEGSVMPLFHALGTPEKDKKLVLYDGGHSPPRPLSIKETLDWFDRTLGPVTLREPRRAL